MSTSNEDNEQDIDFHSSQIQYNYQVEQILKKILDQQIIYQKTVKQLKQEIVTLKAELSEQQEKELTLDSLPSYYDPDILKLTKKKYKSNGVSWNTKKPLFSDASNRSLYYGLHDSLLTEMDNTNDSRISFKIASIPVCIQLLYEEVKNSQQSSNEDAVNEAIMNNRSKLKVYYRKRMKFQKRLEVYKRFQSNSKMVKLFGKPEKVLPYLRKDYMSEDEEDTTPSRSKAIARYRRFIPAWRSKKLNEFYHLLDALYVKYYKKLKRYALTSINLRSTRRPPVNVDKQIGWGVCKNLKEAERFIIKDLESHKKGINEMDSVASEF
ncbi:hypothetical protein BDB01DRAFT_851335 [Pilobolus umbonatus]|nr:hypothetical protein BDB01DRAFT_851335 [Pilobolus umbonatus]